MACAHANELQLRCCNLLQLSHISHMFSHPVALNQTSNTASKAPRLQLQQESGHWREEIARKCPRVPGSGVHFQHAPMWKQLRKRLEVQRVVVSPEDSPEYPGHQAAQISPDQPRWHVFLLSSWIKIRGLRGLRGLCSLWFKTLTLCSLNFWISLSFFEFLEVSWLSAFV